MTEHDAIRQEIREADDRIDKAETRIAKLEDLLDWDHRIGLAFSKQHDNMKKHQMLDMERFNDNLIAQTCLLYTSPSPRDRQKSRMPSSA